MGNIDIVRKDKVKVYIDSECLVCSTFGRYISRSFGDVVDIVSLRHDQETRERLEEAGYDLDAGFFVELGEEIYQGEEALGYLGLLESAHTKKKGRVFRAIVRHNFSRSLGFSIGRILRKALLTLKGDHGLSTNSPHMKGKCGIGKGKCCPSKCFIHFTFGGTMALYGLGKLIGGSETWEMVGNMALGLFGMGGPGSVLALVLGLLVAIVELVGGLSFAAKCGKTSHWASCALAIIMFVALFVHLKGLDLSDAVGYGKVTATLQAIQGPMLYGTVFLAHSIACKMAKKCATGEGDCKEDACCSEKSCDTKKK